MRQYPRDQQVDVARSRARYNFTNRTPQSDHAFQALIEAARRLG